MPGGPAVVVGGVRLAPLILDGNRADDPERGHPPDRALPVAPAHAFESGPAGDPVGPLGRERGMVAPLGLGQTRPRRLLMLVGLDGPGELAVGADRPTLNLGQAQADGDAGGDEGDNLIEVRPRPRAATSASPLPGRRRHRPRAHLPRLRVLGTPAVHPRHDDRPSSGRGAAPDGARPSSGSGSSSELDDELVRQRERRDDVRGERRPTQTRRRGGSGGSFRPTAFRAFGAGAAAMRRSIGDVTHRTNADICSAYSGDPGSSPGSSLGPSLGPGVTRAGGRGRDGVSARIAAAAATASSTDIGLGLGPVIGAGGASRVGSG